LAFPISPLAIRAAMMAAPTTSAGQHRWPELALFRKTTLHTCGANSRSRPLMRRVWWYSGS